MVSEAMLPRAAVREVEQRLTAAGCPDADFDARELFRLATGRDVRLSDRPLTEVNDQLEAAKDAAFTLGVSRGIDPFMTLSFMALPVIPKLRITTRGVVDVDTQQYV